MQIYAKKLVSEGTLSQADADAMVAGFNQKLDQEFDASKSHLPNRADWLDGRWAGFEAAPKKGDRRGDTGVDLNTLRKVGKALVTVPSDFHLHKTIARQLETKAKMFESGDGFDWATAEALAFGTLIEEGTDVRLSGQDSSRGTSASAIRCWSTRKTRTAICRSTMCGRAAAVSKWSIPAVGRSGAGL